MNSVTVTDVQKTTLALATCKANLQPAGVDVAADCAAGLVGGYPDLKVQDPAIFMRHLVAVLAEYPDDVCQLAWKSIPREIPKYKLDIAGIRAWLEERMHERRTAYAEAVEAQRKAEESERERSHAEQVAKDRAAFDAWLEEHPGGTMRQYLGFQAYTAPFQMDAAE